MAGAGVKRRALAALRRAPLALSMPLVRRRIRKAKADQVAVGVARRQMEFLLAETRPDADLDAVALRHLEQVVWRRELRWRPPVITKQAVTGVEHLTEVRGAHGGLVVCFLHHGRYEGVFAALKNAGGPPVTTVGHPMMFDPAIPDYLAANLRLGKMGSTPVPVTLGYTGLRDLVLDGHTLGIAVDLPGSTRVRFVGRDLRCASGAARIAHETGTPVVLVLPRTTDGVAAGADRHRAAAADGLPRRRGAAPGDPRRLRAVGPRLARGLRLAEDEVHAARRRRQPGPPRPRARGAGHLMSARGFLRQLGWSFTSKVVSAALQLVVIVLLARGLEPARFAGVASANVVMMAVVALNGFGLIRQVQYRRSVDRDDPDLPGDLRAVAALHRRQRRPLAGRLPGPVAGHRRRAVRPAHPDRGVARRSSRSPPCGTGSRSSTTAPTT